MAHQVFISYSTRDTEVVEALCNAIEGENIRCWMAPRDVTPGAKYAEDIVTAINKCKVFLLVLSAASNSSPQVEMEVDRAASKDITILTFRIDQVELSKALEYYLGSRHWMDASNPPLEKHISRLVRTIQRLLNPEQFRSLVSKAKVPLKPFAFGLRDEQRLRDDDLLTVVAGRHPQTGRAVRLAWIKPEMVPPAEFLSRFTPLANTLAHIDSPHLAAILDFGEKNGGVFIMQEAVQGTELAGLLGSKGSQQEGLQLDLVLDFAGQLGELLDLLHRRRITQQVFDPAAILVSPENGLHVTDTGISHGADLARLLFEGRVRANCFHAPELLLGEKADVRTDFYSLGALLFLALTGMEPESGSSIGKTPTIADLLPGRLRSGLPAELDDLVARCLHPNPSRRVQSFGEFKNKLEQAQRTFESGGQESLSGAQDALIGQALGAYQIVERLGRGGMAAVYKAYEPALDRYVAVKVLPQVLSNDPAFIHRFHREARAVAQLSHPNIVPIYNFGEERGTTYIVMQLMEGGSLKREQGHALDWKAALNLLLPVARALAFAHQRGIVHRDIKPGNVLLTEDDWPVLADFGLVQMAESSLKLTGTGVGVGTPAYMSPEQGQGEAVDARTDIYSMGIMLYELLTGDVPFKADTPMAVVIKHLTAPMPSPRGVNPAIPAEVEAIILKAAAKDPGDRYQSAMELAAAMDQALKGIALPQEAAPVKEQPAPQVGALVSEKPAPQEKAVEKEKPAPQQVAPVIEKVRVEKPVPDQKIEKKARAVMSAFRLKPAYLLIPLAVVLLALGGIFIPPLLSAPEPGTTGTTVPGAGLAGGTITALPTMGAAPSLRSGAWVDAVEFKVVNEDPAIGLLQSGDVDIYASSGNIDLYKAATVASQADSNLVYPSYPVGSFVLLFNPYGPVFDDARINPFSVPALRSEINRLLDRDVIASENTGGLDAPMLLPIFAGFPDYLRYADPIHELEDQYKYDFYDAKARIGKEMIEMGATLENDKWVHFGQPVTIIFLIRTEDERKWIGDYVADQLEAVNFTVERKYVTRDEASPIWLGSEPSEGQWNLYTCAWLSPPNVERDFGGVFLNYYTPDSNLGIPAITNASQPDDGFLDVARRLSGKDFTTRDEREGLFKSAFIYSLADSLQIWLVEQKNFSLRRLDLQVADDLANGFALSPSWPYTLRFDGQAGGLVRWAQPNVLALPWNPISGSEDTFDKAAILATQDYGLMPDPRTGLAWPQRIEKAKVVVKIGMPVSATLDWVEVAEEYPIDVPEDAWVDWDPVKQYFITAGEKFPEGTSASLKSVVIYPSDLWSSVRWDDGSPLSIADFVMKMILTFDIGSPASKIYDPDSAMFSGEDASLEDFLSHFKGVRIVNTDPLEIETYEDRFELDAELNVYTWWPNYATGPGAWHNLAIGIWAEKQGKLAFSSTKAESLGVEWMDYTGGLSLLILNDLLEEAISSNYVPYDVLTNYVTASEISLRYANLAAWYAARGHFWIGTGPFHLDYANQGLDSLLLKRNSSFPDPAGKWDVFLTP